MSDDYVPPGRWGPAMGAGTCLRCGGGFHPQELVWTSILTNQRYHASCARALFPALATLATVVRVGNTPSPVLAGGWVGDDDAPE